MTSEIKLKVMEAVQDDVNKGIVKIDSTFMKQVDVNPGDVVEIVGERKTAAIVDRALPGRHRIKYSQNGWECPEKMPVLLSVN